MNSYQFERIVSHMAKKYGKIKKGDENLYNFILIPIEGNIWKRHRQHPQLSAVRLKEGLLLAIHTINGYIIGQKADTEAFETEDNLIFRDAVLAAVDPFSNEEIYSLLTEKGEFHENDKAYLEQFYQEPIMCIIRILESVDFWSKINAGNGYFDSLEEYLGKDTEDDNKMNYAFKVGSTHEVIQR